MVGVSGAVIFATLLRLVEEFFDVLGVVGVAGACTSCGGVDVKLESSLQCLNLRGADVSTRSTSDPDDSLSHSEHCLQKDDKAEDYFEFYELRIYILMQEHVDKYIKI